MKHIILAVALCATSAHAEFLDGNRLFERLNGSTSEQMLGLGYVMGVADALAGVLICAPENVTSGQMRDMVRNYLANVPGERHLAADSLVSKVLRATWPCQRRGNGT